MNDIGLFVAFFVTLTSVFATIQFLVYRMYRYWVKHSFEIQNQKVMMRWFYGVLILGNILFFIRFAISAGSWYEWSLVQHIFINPGGIYFASMFLMAFGAILFGIYRFVISKRIKPSNKKNDVETERFLNSVNDAIELQSRRDFLKKAGAIAFTAPLILTTGLSVATHRQYVIARQTLWYPQLPTGLEGLKIAHISDIHSGIYMNRSQMAEIFELVNSLHPDIICITGDLIDTNVSEIPAVISTIDSLKSTYGVFACPGNHDHYASITALESALKSTNVNFLMNDATVLPINGEKFSIAGVDDAGAGSRNFSDINKALKRTDPASFRLLLSHRPDMFDLAPQNNIDLTLSGHTHGGQIGFDFAGVELYPIDFFQKYSRGLYEQHQQKLYVNVGVGLVGVPIRLVRPEITLHTLTSHPQNEGRVVENA